MSLKESGWWRVDAALLLILVSALLLRVWGMDYGIPHPTARPDEERIVGRAYHILATGNPHPGSFDYPSLLMYLNTLALGLYFAVGKLLGHYGKLFDFLFDAAVLHPGLHYEICRAVSIACGVATVAATYLLALHAYRDRGAGLLAAAVLATCYLHVRDSRFATVDVPMTFFVTVSLIFAVQAAEKPSYGNFMLAGVFAGLATSTKYNAGAVLLGLGAAGWVSARKPTSPPVEGSLPGKFLAAAVAFALAFALTSPYVILRYPAALADMQKVGGTVYRPHGALALWTHLQTTFPDGLGWPLFLAAVAGTSAAVWRRRPAERVLLVFLLPFLALIGSVNVAYPRYVLPLLPIFSVLAAELVLSLARKAPRGRIAFCAAATLALAGPGLSASIRFDRVASRKDTRLLASEWVAEHVPPQTEILLCRGYGAPAINTDRRRPPAFRPELIGCAVETLETASGSWVITHEHPQLSAFSRVSADVHRWLEDRATLAAEFSPFAKDAGRKPYFYPSDAFYLPLTGLETMERGGPVIRIWRLSPRDAPGS